MKKTLKPFEGIYRANLEALGKPLIDLLMKHKETPAEVDPELKVHGLKNPDYLVIVGFSTLNVLNQCRKSGKQISRVVIIEPSLERFHALIKREYIKDTLQAHDVDVLIGIPPEEMGPHLYQIMTKIDEFGHAAMHSQNPEIVVDPFAYPPVEGRQHPEAERITHVVIQSAKQVFISMGCASDSHFRWEQLFNNRQSLQESYEIKSLFDKFKDVPAIVIGAGPSMDDFIHAYKEGKTKGSLLIACDAALKKLLAHDIRPHLVTRCERKVTTIFHGIEKKDLDGIYYAAYPWCPREYFELFPESFMMFRGNGVCHFSQYEPGEVNGGVSSANAAMELAFLFGCSKVVLTGVDLCFIDGQSHTKGTEVEFNVEKSKPQWTKIMGNSGEPVTTIPVWNRCLQEYQSSIHKWREKGHNFTVYNTSMKGAQIIGTQATPWSDLNATSNEDPGERIEHYKKLPAPAKAEGFKRQMEMLRGELKTFRKDLEKCFKIVSDAQITTKREEEKLSMQMLSYPWGEEFFKGVHTLMGTLSKIYSLPSKEIDAIKDKYWNKDWFSKTIMDLSQLDVFQTMNKCNALKNLEPMDHERMKKYIAQHISLYRIHDYYSGLLLERLDEELK